MWHQVPYRKILYWHEVRVERLEREVAAMKDGAGVQSVAGGGYDPGMLQALVNRGKG